MPSRKLYCDYVKNLTKKADNIINLELKPLVNCITTVPSDEEFTPTEIIRMLEMWVETAAQVSSYVKPVSCQIDLSNLYYRRGRVLRIVVIVEQDLKEFQSY